MLFVCAPLILPHSHLPPSQNVLLAIQRQPIPPNLHICKLPTPYFIHPTTFHNSSHLPFTNSNLNSTSSLTYYSTNQQNNTQFNKLHPYLSNLNNNSTPPLHDKNLTATAKNLHTSLAPLSLPTSMAAINVPFKNAVPFALLLQPSLSRFPSITSITCTQFFER